MSSKTTQWHEIGDLDIHIADGNYSSKYPRSEEFQESGVPFIRANNLTEKSVSDKDMYFISPQKHSLLLKGHLKANDVLVTTRGDLGKVALVPAKYDNANINAQLVLLRPNPEKIHPLFLLYCFEDNQIKSQVNQLQTGTALKQLPVGNLKKIKIPLPPLEEQRRIAAILDKADEVRRKRREAIRLTEELLRSLFLDMFGDPVTNPNGLEVLEESPNSEARLELLSDVADVIDCKHRTPTYTDEGYPVVRPRDIREQGIDLEQCIKTSWEEFVDLTEKRQPQLGDIVYSRNATFGVASLVDTEKKFTIGQDVCLIVPRTIESAFLHYLLNSHFVRRQLGLAISGSTFKRINLKDIRKLKILVPSKEKQLKFTDFYFITRKKIEALKCSISEADNLFNSLLQRAFRGEL